MRTLKYKTSCYLSSGWFNPDQERSRLAIQVELEKHGISYFSPKDEVIIAPDAPMEERTRVFKMDIDAISDCSFMITNTAGKDMGTLFETGYAHAVGKPIIYYFEPPVPGAKFNVMLATTGIKVVTSQKELSDFLDKLIESNFNYEAVAEIYTGGVE